MTPKSIQRCCACDQPTGRCEEDSIYLPPKDQSGSDLGPLCEACCNERDPPRHAPALLDVEHECMHAENGVFGA
jgi:hypothetical protein